VPVEVDRVPVRGRDIEVNAGRAAAPELGELLRDERTTEARAAD
jgi:hypothetical protein